VFIGAAGTKTAARPGKADTLLNCCSSQGLRGDVRGCTGRRIVKEKRVMIRDDKKLYVPYTLRGDT
jgi:hypothetical protein